MLQCTDKVHCPLRSGTSSSACAAASITTGSLPTNYRNQNGDNATISDDGASTSLQRISQDSSDEELATSDTEDEEESTSSVGGCCHESHHTSRHLHHHHHHSAVAAVAATASSEVQISTDVINLDATSDDGGGDADVASTPTGDHVSTAKIESF